jgi:hypothetical protein
VLRLPKNSFPLDLLLGEDLAMRKNAKEKEVNKLPRPEEQNEEERTRFRITDLGLAAEVLRTVGVKVSSRFTGEKYGSGEWRCRSRRAVSL